MTDIITFDASLLRSQRDSSRWSSDIRDGTVCLKYVTPRSLLVQFSCEGNEVAFEMEVYVDMKVHVLSRRLCAIEEENGIIGLLFPKKRDANNFRSELLKLIPSSLDFDQWETTIKNHVLINHSPVRIVFIEENIPQEIEDESSDIPPVLLLLRVVHRTIELGGKLAKELFVPRDIWFQSGARVANGRGKVGFCKKLVKSIESLRHVALDSDENELCNSVDAFVASLQNNIQRNLHGGNRGRQTSIIEVSYAKWVSLATSECEFLTSLWKKLSLSNETSGMYSYSLDRLSRVFALLGFSLCRFVVSDIRRLLRRYVSLSRQSLSRDTA